VFRLAEQLKKIMLLEKDKNKSINFHSIDGSPKQQKVVDR
jgi:hypothetical protein